MFLHSEPSPIVTSDQDDTPRVGASAYERPSSGEQGFTLIEMMLALGVFMIGLMGIVAIQIAASRGVTDSGQLTLATNLATNKLDELRLADVNTISTDAVGEGYNQYSAYTGVGPGYFTVTWTVTGTDVKTVVVTTKWKRGDSDHDREITARTMMTR